MRGLGTTGRCWPTIGGARVVELGASFSRRPSAARGRFYPLATNSTFHARNAEPWGRRTPSRRCERRRLPERPAGLGRRHGGRRDGTDHRARGAGRVDGGGGGVP